MYRKLLKTAVAMSFVGSLLFSSGCALFWLGAGGAGGYLIRKGEEGGDGSRRSTPESGRAEKTY